MPNYDILHKPTGEVTERFMTISQLETFLAENPDYEVTFLKMNIGDPVVLGVHRPPSDFTNHVLAPIERHYNNGKQRDTRFGRKTRQV
jgi:hypothetical protein